MANMSYCRFENTLRDLRDCYESMLDPTEDELSESERKSRDSLISLCERIVDEFGDEEVNENDKEELA